MCGITGMVADHQIDEGHLAAATRSLAHRGPDDEGVWLSADRTVGLGHRRLSILDLSAAGHQPFARGELVLTYNGEIYNFLALRDQLAALGHAFVSRTDTEVILAAYQAWGPACVRRFRGMFAFALWDAPRRRLFCARDRLGIKPFHYYRDPRRLAFASELKAFEAWPGLDLSVDDTALYDFLTYIYIPAPKTAYARVGKLPPGHTLLFESGKLAIEPYWDVSFSGAAAPRDSSEGLRAHLEDAVRAHMLADVPVGSLLSGGVDSSAVTALARAPLRTFSIGFDVAEHSETHYARAVAEHLGTDHVEATVTVDSAERLLPRLGGMYDEPFADSSAIPTHIVAAVARKTVKVALSGDGGDEVFGGYGWYTRHLRRARFARVPRVLRDHLPALVERTPLMRLRGIPTVVDGLRPDLERHVAILGGFTRAQKRHVLTDAARRHFRDYDDLWAFRRHFHADLDPMSRWQYLDLKTYLPDDILTKVDRASMAVSLEVRPPLLDHHLVEYVATLPAALRNPKGALKHLFKRAVADLLPREILERRKQGFSVPMAAWIARLGGRADLPPMQSFVLLTLRAFAARRAIRSPCVNE